MVYFFALCIVLFVCLDWKLMRFRIIFGSFLQNMQIFVVYFNISHECGVIFIYDEKEN